MPYDRDLEKRLKKVNEKVRVETTSKDECRVLLLFTIQHARPMIKAVERDPRLKVERIVKPDIKIDDTALILYVRRLRFRTAASTKESTKKKKSTNIIKAKHK